MPRAVAAFHKRYLDVELALTQAEPEDATELLRAGELDLAIVYGFDDDGRAGRGARHAHLIDDRYDLLVALDHPLADKGADPHGGPGRGALVNSTQASGCAGVLHACAQAGFEPHVAFETDEILAIQALVANGMGVALMPQLALTAVHPGVAVRPDRRRGADALRLRSGAARCLSPHDRDAAAPGRHGRGVPAQVERCGRRSRPA